jgi:hypothetical protein
VTGVQSCALPISLNLEWQYITIYQYRLLSIIIEYYRWLQCFRGAAREYADCPSYSYDERVAHFNCNVFNSELL